MLLQLMMQAMGDSGVRDNMLVKGIET